MTSLHEWRRAAETSRARSQARRQRQDDHSSVRRTLVFIAAVIAVALIVDGVLNILVPAIR